MKHKLFLPIFCTIVFVGLAFAITALASSGTCPRDDGHGVICSGNTPYYCMNSCMNPTHCPTWSTGPGVCAAGVTCPANCAGTDSCGYCNSCVSGKVLCGSYPEQTCQDSCTESATILKLGIDSIGVNNVLYQSAGSAFSLLQSGNIGFGTSTPQNQLHIKNSSGPIINLQGPTTNYRGLRIATSDTDNTEKWFAGVNDANKQQFVIRTNNIDALMIHPDTKKITASSLATAGTFCLQADSSGTISKATVACDGVSKGLAGGQQYYVPIWNNASSLGTSTIYQASYGNIGINTTIPDSNSRVQINASEGKEGLRIISASNYSPLNIMKGGNDIFRVDQNGSLAVGTVPWTSVSDKPLTQNCESGKFVNAINIGAGSIGCGTPSGGGQWNTDGNNIYSANSGNVGIGTGANPDNKLTVMGTASFSGQVTVPSPTLGTSAVNKDFLTWANITGKPTSIKGCSNNQFATNLNLSTGVFTCSAPSTGGGVGGSGTPGAMVKWGANNTLTDGPIRVDVDNNIIITIP